VWGRLLNVGKYGGTRIRKRLNRGPSVGIQSKIERKSKFRAHSWDTVYLVCPIDGAAISSIGGYHGSFDPYQGRATIGTSNGDGFVGVAK
jgi:hypothetical protein